ncbi:MAG: LPS export ABC transporter periplasmic protein LptC, partial [Thermoanaerobaculia bacterium]
MAKAPRELPIRLIRRALLVALVGFLVSVVALYVLGRIGRPETARSEPGGLLDEADTELQFSGEGFDYEVSRRGRKVIHVKAERVLSMKDDDYELQGVELVMIRQDEGEYSLASDSAFYNLATQAASFRGNVRFSGPQGVYLTADGLELVDDGRLIVSSSPVRFRFLDRFHGRADRLRITPSRNIFILAGHVKVDTLQGDASPMSLHCRRFAFDRDRRLLRAEGGVRLLRGDDYLRARRLSVTLSQDEKRIDFIQARWDVFGGVRQPAGDGSTSIVTFEGRELSVTLEGDPEVPKKGELSGGPYGPAVLSVKDASGLRRRIKADYLVGDFVDGDLRQAQGLDNVVMDEFLDLEPEVILRSACGDTAVANFSNGQLGSFRLEGDVELHGDALQATGNQLDMADPESEVALTGTPAWAIREQGELRAPRIVYD